MAFINRCLHELLSCHALIMRHVIGSVHPRHASKLTYGPIYPSLCNPSNKVSWIVRKRFNSARYFHPTNTLFATPFFFSYLFSRGDFPLVYFVSKTGWIECTGTYSMSQKRWNIRKMEEQYFPFVSLLTKKHWPIDPIYVHVLENTNTRCNV